MMVEEVFTEEFEEDFTDFLEETGMEEEFMEFLEDEGITAEEFFEEITEEEFNDELTEESFEEFEEPMEEIATNEESVPEVIEDEKGNKVPNNSFLSSALINYETTSKLQRAGISSYMNSLYKKELQRKDLLLYAITPNTGDDFKRSLRQFKVNKDKVVITVIYSKTK